ncbi:GNAT family N-acetyltransferase, partial [Lactobacillus delbrueckii subsp. bulgaricus]
MCLKLKFKYLDFLNKAFTIYVETTKGEICLTKVERLLINYKTLEEFK